MSLTPGDSIRLFKFNMVKVYHSNKKSAQSTIHQHTGLYVLLNLGQIEVAIRSL